MRARALPTLLASVALIGAACSDDRRETAPSTPDDDPGAVRIDEPTDADGNPVGGGGGIFPQLAPFADCSTFLAHIKAEAAERVGPYGLDMYPSYWFEDDVLVEEEMADEAMAEEPADEPASEPAAAGETAQVASDDAGDSDAATDGGDFTGTNVQEVGIDEADLVKTDGRRILVISDNVFSYIDVSSGDPLLIGQTTLPEGWGHEMFFQGDRAFVITNGGSWGVPVPMPEPIATTDAEAEFADEPAIEPAIEPGVEGPAAVIMEVDLSDATKLDIVGTLKVQGQYLSARAIGDRVRLAVSSAPMQLPWVYPQSSNGEDRATQTNREIIEESSLEQWLPSYSLQTADGTRSGQLLACERMHRPAEFSGFETVSVIDLDLAGGLPADLTPQDATGVLAGGQTVYSSMDRFYIATTSWAGATLPADEREAWSEEFETQIHGFAIAAGEPTEYVASGSVPGTLLNQFSMDEHEGFLRILTTTGSPWGGGDLSATGLTVLEEQDDRLVQVGFVGGLGEGEQLFSARLMGDIGFAVTFRQIDPFYVLDLSDPRNPTVTGELKIPGVSTYLQQLDENRVLGIGQDATPEGMTIGVKMSIFDVSDPANPVETHVWTLENASSAAEWDHRAFQMIGSTAILPVESWNDGFYGAIVFDLSDGITELGRIEHLPAGGEPTSDCRPVDADSLTPEASEFWWFTQDANSRVQICGPDAVGGWTGSYCEIIPSDDIQYWFWDEASAEADLAALGLQDGDRIELCWLDNYGQNRIIRSLVIDDTLWTISPGTVQANALDGFAVEGQVTLR